MLKKVIFTILVIAGMQFTPAEAARIPEGITKYSDIVYAKVDGKDLKLDIYVPKTDTPPPLLIWIHGGAWKIGSKANINPAFFQLLSLLTKR